MRPDLTFVLRAGRVQPGDFPAVWRSPRLGAPCLPDPHGDLLATRVVGVTERAIKVAYALGLLLHYFAQTSAQTPARSRLPQSDTAPVPSARLIKAPAFWIYDARVEGRRGGDTPRCLPCAAARAGGRLGEVS